MKDLAKVFAPVLMGFTATALLHFSAPESFAFLHDDESHIFDNARSINIENPIAQNTHSTEKAA